MDESIESGRPRVGDKPPQTPSTAGQATEDDEDLSAPWPPELSDDFERTVGTFGDFADEGFGVGLWRHAWLRRAR